MTVSCCDVSVMKTTNNPTANGSSRNENRPLEDNLENRINPGNDSLAVVLSWVKRSPWEQEPSAQDCWAASEPQRQVRSLSPGDAALLRFPAALEILEADFWIQYNELGGIQDDEVPGGNWQSSLYRGPGGY